MIMQRQRPALQRVARVAIIAAPLLSCSPQKTQTMPQKPFHAQRAGLAQAQPKCAFEGNTFHYTTPDGHVRSVDDIFECNESMIDVGCRSRYAFILTNKALLAVPGFNTPMPTGSTEWTSHVRIFLDHIFEKGFVAWTHSEESAYILTKNRELRMIFPDLTKDIDVYKVPFDVQDAKMAYFSGYVHVGTAAGNLFSASTRADKEFTFKFSPVSDPAFSVSGDTLSFGNIAITVEQGNVVAKEKEK